MPSRQQTINQALQALRARDYPAAVALLAPLCGPTEPVDDAQQLLASAHSRLGESALATDLYSRYLETHPNNPAVWNNYGNHLKLIAPAQALSSYQRALQLKPKYPDALYNLALCQHRAEDSSAALQSLDQLAQLDNQQAREKQLRGIIELERNQVEAARRNFSAYLQLKPGNASGLLNLAIAHRRLGERQQALAILDQAPGNPPPSLTLERCAILQELGEREQAAADLAALVDREPLLREAHDMLDRHHFEQGDRAAVGASLRRAHSRTGQPELLGDLALKLERLDQPDQAQELLDKIGELVSRDADLLRLKARLLTRAGQPAAAAEVFTGALAQFPRHRELLLDLFRFRLRGGETEAAAQLTENLLQHNPNDQEAWSYLSTLWKLLGDDRYHWLCDYQRFVGEFALADTGITDGYISELCDYLRSLHGSSHAPLDQTLRGGTQTTGALFNRRDSVVETLVEKISMLVTRHIDQLPTDHTHPLLRRKSSRFHYSGSWSVRLRQQGYHINHNHREGWLSSALYLCLPPMRGEDYPAGCLQLGQSNLHLGVASDPVERVITPEVGKLVLFPSYLWHGTVPFTDGSERLSVAFDIVPD